MISETQIRMGQEIIRFEGRYQDGKLQVYDLPAGDGGGDFEVAGINERYHPEKARELANLIGDGRHEEAEREAAIYIANYTDAVTKFFPDEAFREENPGVEFVLRDCAFNRGAKGAAAILQIALDVDVDGVVGPATKAAFGLQLSRSQTETVANLTKAREVYERSTYPWKKGARDESSKFWKGLSNRWAKANAIAHETFIV